ncbi:amino acid adenylation domain-containing protein [Crossiella sp. NPDC003009]
MLSTRLDRAEVPTQSPDNGTGAPYPRDSCLTELFDAVAAAHPDAIAAIHHGQRLNFRDLRNRSVALAARLRAAQVRPGDRVGVCGRRSLPALVAFLGVLRAGAAYVPLDDTDPPARLAALAEDADVRTAVLLPGGVSRVRRLRAWVQLDDTDPGPMPEPEAEPTPATACAYVMGTSGSSGRPKAVAVAHRGVVRLARSEFAPGAADRILHGYALSSDASTIEIWSALLNGACLVLVDRDELLAPAVLAELLRTERVTVAYLTTSVFHHLARTDPAALRPLRFASAGGEAMDPDLARAVLTACQDTTVVNFYGPTENTVVSTAQVVRDVPAGATSVPIGRPLAHSHCYVLREDGSEAAVGEEGELAVGGDGLALGYLGDPELTARRFGTHPTRPGVRIYRTGDRAEWRADGALEYRGRRDRQVKVRGHRIELDEVEARLRADPAVGEAVVELTGQAGAELTGYVTPAEPGLSVPLDRLRRDLAAWLPAAAVPGRLVELPVLPVATGGKVDRKALVAQARTPAATAPARPAAPDRWALRDALAEVWQTVLRVRPQPTDDLFALGGDSLLAAEVVTRTVTVLGLDAAHGSRLVRCLLQDSTLDGFATAVHALRRGHDVTGGSAVDFAAEGRLGFPLPPPRPGRLPCWQRPEHVLLTGASGFVGAFLLDSLVRRTGAVVHCPVRARDAGHARRRVLANLAHYGLSPDADRIECFPGDLCAPSLGLAREHAARLADQLDLVVHAGAQVNFLYPYPALRESNVDGTREVVRLAASRRVPVHFLSTVAVLAGTGTAGVRHVPEDLPLAHAERLSMGYAESKWVAEQALRDAAAQGLPVAVHRPYEVTGDQRHGVCNTDTAICSLFRMVAETGLAPDIPLPMDFVPVDHLADAVVHIATRHPTTDRTYHLTNPNPATFADVLDRMRAAGCRIRTLPYPEWVGELVRHVAAHPTSPTAPFVSLCVDRCHSADISVKEMYFEGTFPELGRDNAERALAGSGLECPPVDTALLDKYLGHLFDSGYLPRPTPERG